MGTRSSRHNKGRKPLYKEHRFGTMSDESVLAANENEAAELLKEYQPEDFSKCTRCGAEKFPGSVGLCKACYTRGNAFLGDVIFDRPIARA